jgi:hypothetical protein
MSQSSRACAACGSRFWSRMKYCDVTICFMCGSWAEALDLLARNYIAARDVRELLCRHHAWRGITLEVARLAIEVFKTRDENGH